MGAWGAAADGTLETRLYFCQNWRADVVAVLDSGGAILRECRYTAYGKRVEIDAGDFDRDGSVDFFDVDAFEACFDDDDCPPGRTADVNRDGFVDFMDYDAFFAAYDADLETAHGGVRTLYAGYERDPGLETPHADGTRNDIYHVRHRVYSTDLGRWTRRDPLGYVDGMSVYEYVGCTVLTTTDKSGLLGQYAWLCKEPADIPVVKLCGDHWFVYFEGGNPCRGPRAIGLGTTDSQGVTSVPAQGCTQDLVNWPNGSGWTDHDSRVIGMDPWNPGATHPGRRCYRLKGCSLNCICSSIQLGANTGLWVPGLNDCNTTLSKVLSACGCKKECVLWIWTKVFDTDNYDPLDRRPGVWPSSKYEWVCAETNF